MLIVGIHLEGGSQYEHITRVRWKMIASPNTYDGEASVSEVVGWIKASAHIVWSDGSPVASVYVNNRNGREFIESRADSTRSNNLLTQPRF